MMIKRKIIILLCFIFSCKKYENIKRTSEINKKIPILILGSFHFTKTSDANSTNYKYNEKEINQITEMISKFNPSIICIEFEPKYNVVIKKNFQNYIKSKKFNFDNKSEAEIFSYKIAKLSSTKQIECIDHKLGYNYEQIERTATKYGEKTYLKLKKKFEPINKQLSELQNLREKLILINSNEYKSYLKNINADILAYTNSDSGFEGADIASEFYRRNIRIFANLNKINVEDNDKILIIFGAGHVPFLEELIKTSPKYKLENLDNFLK